MQIILHAGQHKTGSTSIQTYLKRHSGFLGSRDIAVGPDWTPDLSRIETRGLFSNAIHVAHAILRDDLQTPVRLRSAGNMLPAESETQGLVRINRYLRNLPETCVTLSAEAFSFLRQPDEMRRLEILCTGMEFRAIMFLRQPHSWLESWKRQVAHAELIRLPGATPGSGIFDFAEDSWLTDHDAIRRFWGDRCTFFSYETVMLRYGSVIPALLEALGLDPARCPGWDDLFLNAAAEKLTGKAKPWP